MKTANTEQHASQGIYTDLNTLLQIRHWAQKLALFSRTAARSMLLGETRSQFRGRGMEFAEVRPYQAGDDIRTIDWRVSARTNSTYTKLFCEERERPVHILIDQRNTLFFGSTTQFKSVLAAELACAIAWATLAGSDRIGGQIIGDNSESDIRARRSKQSVLRFIHDLNEFNHALPINSTLNTSSKSLTDSLEECRRITRPGTAVFIISDFHDFDQTTAKALSTLGKHTDITLIQVVDPLEQTLPLMGTVAISNGYRDASVQLNTPLKHAYQRQLKKQQQQLKKATIAARALYTKIDTTQTARHVLTTLYGT